MAAKLSGGGGGKYEISQNADINVTPFVDIMLVLLIIFMVSIPVATVSIKLDLPPATPPTNAQPKEPTFVSVERDGSVFIGDQQTTLADLAGALVGKIGGNAPTEERIFVRANAEVRYEDFMNVMNELQDNGFYEIGLISEDIS